LASEAELIAAISQVFAAPADSEIIVGIGDDAAVVRFAAAVKGASVGRSEKHLVLAADMAVEGVHFNRSWSTLFEIGAKTTGANLADIFAMGAKPRYILVSAALPSDFTVEQARELATGIMDEASKVGALVVGGDLARSDKNALVLSISVTGEVRDPITRSGAQVGDLVIISRYPGQSAAGLELLRAGINDERTAEHKRPTIDYEAATAFALAGVSSMIDVSDSLASELAHLARASGVGIEILSDPAMNVHGGEDHIFLATISPQLPMPRQAIEIGRVVFGKGVRMDGAPLIHNGFNHFDAPEEFGEDFR